MVKRMLSFGKTVTGNTTASLYLFFLSQQYASSSRYRNSHIQGSAPSG